MAEEHGVPARNLTDAELERQGVQAHATRHWVFLHGTAEQFRTHTHRMLELEQQYLRRHPQRTWQGSGGGDGAVATTIAREARIRDLVHTLTTEVFSLLDATARAAPGAGAVADAETAKPSSWRRSQPRPMGPYTNWRPTRLLVGWRPTPSSQPLSTSRIPRCCGLTVTSG